MRTIPIIPSVNYHLTESCNMNCKYCFATFKDVKKQFGKSCLKVKDAKNIISQIGSMNLKKITFVGGEPLLYKGLDELIIYAKKIGLTTMVVSNGSLLSNDWIKNISGHLDWIGLSIDCLDKNNNINIGRHNGNQHPLTKERYYEIINSIRHHNIRLKINTVVSKFNYKEDFSKFINFSMPERWKVLQPLKIIGQNETRIDEVMSTDNQFLQFMTYHKQKINSQVKIVSETNDDMTGSYLMIDPVGRFYDNTKGEHTYSKSILDVGIKEALKDVSCDYDKFIERGGQYE